MILTKKLTQEDQQDLVQALFGFNFEYVSEGHMVLVDEKGFKFYGNNDTSQFDFSTLRGVFSYTAHRAKIQGFEDAQYKIREALGL